MATIKTINLQLVKNVGNYETVRIGGEWSIDNGETIEQAMKKANNELNKCFVELMQERDEARKPAKQEAKQKAPADPNDTREEIFFGTPRFQQVVNRIIARGENEEKTDIETIKRFFKFGEKEEKTILAAIQLNVKL